MQTLALAFAISLLSLGALLNTLVLAYFVWRTCRVARLRDGKYRPRIARQALRPAHR